MLPIDVFVTWRTLRATFVSGSKKYPLSVWAKKVWKRHKPSIDTQHREKKWAGSFSLLWLWNLSTFLTPHCLLCLPISGWLRSYFARASVCRFCPRIIFRRVSNSICLHRKQVSLSLHSRRLVHSLWPEFRFVSLSLTRVIHQSFAAHSISLVCRSIVDVPRGKCCS